MGDRLRQQPVGEPGIAWEQRPVQVRADRAADTAAFPAALAVIAEPGHDPAERSRLRVEASPAGVVLEAGERPPPAGLELALEQDVADEAPVAGDRLVRKEPDAGELAAGVPGVAPAEQLVAAADREHGGSA